MIANYCLIKQNLASLVADSSDDSDRYPDVAQISGQVTFTPTTPQGQTYKIRGENGELYTVPVTAITAKIEDGKIMHEDKEGVYLFAGGKSSNPEKVVYRASYSGLRAGGRGGAIALNAVTFEAIPGGEIDLTTVTPVSGTPAPGIVKGDPFLYEDFTPEQLEALRGPQGEPGPLTFADFTPEQLEIIRGPQGDKGDKGDKGDQGIPGDVTQLRGEITTEIAALVDGAPEDLDTLREIAAYAEANREITDQLNAAIGGKADKVHTHAQSDITGLSTALSGKADKTHTHSQSQITGLATALGGKADTSHTHSQSDITGLSEEFDKKADSSHTHAQSDITGLSTTLSGKAAKSHAHTTADITDFTTEMDNKADKSHTHSQSDITGLSAEFDKKADSSHKHTTADITNFATEMSKKADTSHTHSQSDITGLSTALSGKADSTHTHPQGEVTGLATALNGKASKSHTHTQDQVTGLSTALDDKADKSHTHTVSQVTGAASTSYVDGRIQLVTALPSNPDPSVLYLVEE